MASSFKFCTYQIYFKNDSGLKTVSGNKHEQVATCRFLLQEIPKDVLELVGSDERKNQDACTYQLI